MSVGFPCPWSQRYAIQRFPTRIAAQFQIEVIEITGSVAETPENQQAEVDRGRLACNDRETRTFGKAVHSYRACGAMPARRPRFLMLKQKLILASKSPRRAELLRAAGWPFEAVAANIDETRQADEPAVAYVQRLAQTKAEKVAQQFPDDLVLGADTTVVVGDNILEQPGDDATAQWMLKLLSGKWHQVLTGVALVRVSDARLIVAHELTQVRFAELSAAEIDWYVSTGEPLDKAGAYGIQGGAAPFIEEIQGDYFNIVGLPMRLVYKLVRKHFA